MAKVKICNQIFYWIGPSLLQKIRGPYTIVLDTEVPEFEGLKKKSMMKCKQMNQDILMNGSSQKKMLLEGNSFEQKKNMFFKNFSKQ